MTQEEKDLSFVKNVYGGKLPEIDPVYYDGAKVWEKFDKHPAMTPYVMAEIYTPEEMRMIMCLPAKPKEVAEKLGLTEEYCEKTLRHLFDMGRVSPGQRYHLETLDTFTPTYNPVTLRDHIGMAFNKFGIDWATKKEMFMLADEWDIPAEGLSGLGGPDGKNVKGSRIIPKYGSIKNIPGVMPSENFKKGTVSVMRCVCKSYQNFRRYGTANLPDGGGCESGLKERADSKNGHCLQFGQRAKFAGEHLGYFPQTIEEVDQIIAEAEDAVVIYNAKNMPEVGTICTCCNDCCPILYRLYANGIDGLAPSRFRPEVNADKCVGCKTCEKRCMFNAITFDANGKCVVDPDKCKGCGNCVIKCPTKALKMVTVHDTDWIPDIEDYIK